MGVYAKAVRRAQSCTDRLQSERRQAWRNESKGPTNPVRIHCTVLHAPSQLCFLKNQLLLETIKVRAGSPVDVLVALCLPTPQQSSSLLHCPRETWPYSWLLTLLFAQSSLPADHSCSSPLMLCPMGSSISVSSLGGCPEFQALHMDIRVPPKF